MELLYIHWNPDPILFSIAGIAIRWYSIFWFIAILAGSQVVYKLYQSKGLPVDTFQNLFLYSFLGIFIGARLGHCLFYEPDYYLSHPLEIVLPVHFYPDGDWKFTGYAGLASHGGTLGLIIALAIFCRKTKIHYLDILDMMGIAAPVAAVTGFAMTHYKKCGASPDGRTGASAPARGTDSHTSVRTGSE